MLSTDVRGLVGHTQLDSPSDNYIIMKDRFWRRRRTWIFCPQISPVEIFLISAPGISFIISIHTAIAAVVGITQHVSRFFTKS